MRAFFSMVKTALRQQLQYRSAMLAGVFTQLVFGLILIMVYTAFYDNGYSVMGGMALGQAVSYVWLSQGTYRMMPWSGIKDVEAMMRDGRIAFELARPLDLYNMWFARSMAMRTAPLLTNLPLVLLAACLMAPYGIAGAYQPAVQASIPALILQENFMRANAVINTISSVAALLGPVLGGILYSIYGLMPILEMCMVCFILSAVMEIFIRIPYKKREKESSILKTVKKDIGESVRFICREKPVIGKGLLVVCCFNLFLSTMIMIGLPYLITEVMDFDTAQANRLYGCAEGALAAGGLAGGIGAGILADRLQLRKTGNLLIVSAACVFPMGLALLWLDSAIAVYLIMVVCCFVIMMVATVFSIQVMAFVQAQTPQSLVGKVISACMMISMCAQPVGNAMYGFLFEICAGYEALVILFAGVVSLVVAFMARKVFSRL